MSNQSTFSGDTISEQKIKKKKQHANRKRKNPHCKKCGDPKKHINEPMVSGFVGYLCINDDCVIDS